MCFLPTLIVAPQCALPSSPSSFKMAQRLSLAVLQLSLMFILNFDSKTSILAISEKQNAVKMGINEKRDARFVKM